MSIPDLPRNPCAIFGLPLERGAEIIGGILVTLKGTYLMAVLSGWAALKLGWEHRPSTDNPETESLFMKDLNAKISWVLIDAVLSFVTEWILLTGIWRKNRTMCYNWMCTNALKGFRVVFLGPQKHFTSLLFRVFVGLYEYWVIWAYSEQLKLAEAESYLIPESMPLKLNAMCTIAFLLEIYLIFWNPIGVSPAVIFITGSSL